MDRLPSSFIRPMIPRTTAGTSVTGTDISVTGAFRASPDSARGIFWSSSDPTEDKIDIESSPSPLSWASVFGVSSKPQCSSRRLRRLRTSKRTVFSETSGLLMFVNSLPEVFQASSQVENTLFSWILVSALNRCNALPRLHICHIVG